MVDNQSQLNVYEFHGFEVQSYFGELKTRQIFEYVIANKIMGRTGPPRKGFLGMVGKLLWEKKFSFKGEKYVIQGGGKKVAVFEAVPVDEQKEAKKVYRRCNICQVRHPESDLRESKDGPMCIYCYEALFPPCAGCGCPLELPEDLDPDDGPFYCDNCLDKEEDY